MSKHDSSSLIRPAGARGAVLGFLAGGLMLAAPLQADTLRDPTRPPDAWLAAQAAQAAQAGADQAVARPQQAGAHVAVIGAGRRYAVIDGQVVTTGDVVNGARVVSISPAQVTLVDQTGRRTLPLASGVEKRPAAPIARQPAGRRTVTVTGNHP